MTQKQIEIVKSSWLLVADIDPAVVGNLFYNRLFELEPQVKEMFRKPINEQSKKLLAMIGYVIAKLDNLDSILPEVTKLAQRHVDYGVQPFHYKIVGEALLWTLEKGLGKNWNEETEESWTACYSLLSNAMVTAVEEEKHEAA